MLIYDSDVKSAHDTCGITTVYVTVPFMDTIQLSQPTVTHTIFSTNSITVTDPVSTVIEENTESSISSGTTTTQGSGPEYDLTVNSNSQSFTTTMHVTLYLQDTRMGETSTETTALDVATTVVMAGQTGLG